MACKLCARLRAHLWEKTDAWERAYASEQGPWSDDPVKSLELVEQAYAVQKTDPDAAHELFLDAAEAGSAWAMNVVAFRYWTGDSVAEDLDWAEEYYRRAIDAGSWMATTHFARLLDERGRHDESDQMLKDCVERDFAPAFFWLGMHQYRRRKSRMVYREIRPMLEHAADAGHPAAHAYLGSWMLCGKFGLRYVPTGFKWMSRWMARPEAQVDLYEMCRRAENAPARA